MEMELQTLVFSKEQEALIKSQIGPTLNNDELLVFMHVAKRAGLDPLAKQIYAIKRGGKMTIQTAIDGFRAIADRTGRHVSSLNPLKSRVHFYMKQAQTLENWKNIVLIP